MDALSLLALALALAMDAFAVALAAGAGMRQGFFAPCFRLAASFGFFQWLMPVLGWAAGLTLAGFVHAVSHWVAFALLAFIGGRMIWEALREDAGEERPHADPSRGLTLLALAVATSIDALAVGLSFAVLNLAIWRPALVIGLTAFLMTILGCLLGRRAGLAWGGKVEILGGAVLIVIGTKILVTGLLGG